MTGTAAPGGNSWYSELFIKFADGVEKTFFIELTRSGTHIPHPTGPPAPWTALEFHKCPGCPLAAAVKHCPAALSLETTVSHLKGRVSHETVTATAVDGGNRISTVTWPLQEVASTFVQLAVFSSGCPIGGDFKSMLRDLRPFSTTKELVRHLIGKVLLKHRGEVEASKKDILDRLEPLRVVFLHLKKRLSYAGMGGDAVANSIVRMDAVAGIMAMQIGELFDEAAGEMGWPREARAPAAAPARRAGFFSRFKDFFRSAAL